MIRTIVLRNAGPFRGEHVIELDSKAYAVTARYESDPGRSNWGGKSFLLEMVEFALTGKLAKSRRYDADGWITEGANEGAVGLVLEGGAAIKRERKRGKATQVTFSGPGGKATQDEADVAILKHLAFAADDFKNVAYFEQGEMKRLIRTEPEKRFDIVRGWLGLEKAEKAEDRAGKMAGEATRDLLRVRGKREAVRTMLEQLGEIPDAHHLEKMRDEMQVQMDRAAADIQRQQDHGEKERRVAAFDELIALGKQVAAELEKFPKDVQERAAKVQAELGEKAGRYAELDKDVVRKKKVSLGQFDGACPVLSGFACPAKKEINADRGTSTTALEDARRVRDEAQQEYETAKQIAEGLLESAGEARAKTRELARIRERAEELQPDVKVARKHLKANPKPDPTAFDMAGLRRVHGEAVQAVSDAHAKHAQKDRLERELAHLDEAVEGAEQLAAIAISSRNVLRATQRRVAERALDQIGGRSGSMMHEAGIDLTVKVQWEREGKNYARACELCGAPFPASAKAKTCAECGAERGMNVVQKLEFILSNRSGAADDLAGVALQLAAGAWLLHARSSPWACAMLDEPLAACDKTNRRALAGQLIRLLGAGTWRQALVISHSPDIIDIYPGRIEVVVARDGSRRIVQT